jgi:hypothetical protein
MSDEAIGILALAGLVVVVIVLGAVARRIALARTLAAMPEPSERLEHLRLARRLRDGGASLEECIERLRGLGLKAGVAKSLVLDMERQQAADVEHPVECRWREFRFRHPRNWRVAPIAPQLGPAAAISVEGLGSAMFLLVALGSGGLGDLIAEQERQIRDPARSPLREWGRLPGEGVRLVGVHARTRMPMELVVFRPAEGSFALVEFHAVEEDDLVAPGFALIRETFEQVA